VAFKLEFLNPTGSHKDRGVSLMTSFLSAHGVTDAVEDSSGNAGSSFAAYAARAGINARIFVPDYASGPKRLQIGGYGQKVVRILGKRSDVTEAVKREAEKGTVYASHAYLPQLLPGFATAAYEIFEQMGRAPEAVVAPVGQGTLLLGIGRGFDNLKRAGLIDDVPRLIGVQAMACAPLWALQSFGMQGMGFVTEGETLAEGVRVRYPLHGDAVLRAVEGSRGFFVAVDEEVILKGRDELGRRGFYVEATSAIIWDALSQISGKISGPIAVILTGHGLKSAT
jgi:threonine synthase